MDLETIKFYGEVRLVQVYHESFDEVLIVDWPDEHMLAYWLITVRHAFHNESYDISTLQRRTGLPLRPSNYEDTFLLARLHFWDKHTFALDDVMTYVLGSDPYLAQRMDKKLLQKSDWKGVLTEEQYRYAATDVYFMPQVYKEVSYAEESFSYKLDKLTLSYCFKFQTHGLAVDQDIVAREVARCEKIIADIALPINSNSYVQVRPYIGSDESDAEGLAKLALAGSQRAKDVRDTRKYRLQLSYLHKFQAERIYGVFKPSARSGRLTCDKQNLQQIPSELKCCFQAPDGRVLIRADFSQLELRIACAVTKERRMEKILREGGDLHSYTAEMLMGIAFTKQQRAIAKSCNFNLLYGGGAGMLGSILLKQADIYLEFDDLCRYRNMWLNLWPAIALWQTRGTAKQKMGQKGVTPLGRQYVGKRYTDYMNIEVQGGGAEVAKLAMHYMYDKIEAADGLFVNFVHDEYVIECDDDETVYKEIAVIMAESMKEAWEECSKSFAITDIPMPVEVNVGMNLGELSEGVNAIYTYKLEA